MYRLRIPTLFSIVLFALATLVACGPNDDDSAANDEADDNDAWEVVEDDDSEDEVAIPSIEVTPPHIAFPHILPDDDGPLLQSEAVEIHNAGSAELQIDNIELVAGADHFVISEMTGLDDDGSATLDYDSSDSVTFVVEFEEQGSEPAQGAIEIASDDPSNPVTTIELSGNSTAPCIDVTTAPEVDFGSVSIDHSTSQLVTLQNCSLHSELQLEDIEFSDDAFSLGDQTGDDIDSMAPGVSSSFLVEFTPDEEGSHQGQLDILSNSPKNPVQTLNLHGEGVDTDCIVAEALGAASTWGGDPVGFDDSVEVDVNNPVALKAEIVDDAGHDNFSYSWKLVESPPGSLDNFGKSDSGETTLGVQSIGEYAVQLVVTGDDGVASCEPSTVHIASTTDQEIHIQLTWLSPQVELAGGVDVNAARGVDLDLHYVRPGASWGEPSNSIYWEQPEQDWSADGKDNAQLYIDSLLGANPANIIHSDPEEGAHHVGVHVYRDYCWGFTDATVRIHFEGELVSQQTQRLHNTDYFWFVGDIDWSEDPEFVTIDDIEETFSLTSYWDIMGEAC